MLDETRPLYGYLTLQGPAKTIQRFCTAYPDWTVAPLGADRPHPQRLPSIAGIRAEFGPYAWEGSQDALLTWWTAISRHWPTLWFRWELFVWNAEEFPEDEDPDADAVPGYLCTVWLRRGQVASQTHVSNSETVRAFLWMTRGLIERDLEAPDAEPWDWSELTIEEQWNSALNALEAAWAAQEMQAEVQAAWREIAQARLADPHEALQAQIDALETRTEPEEWEDLPEPGDVYEPPPLPPPDPPADLQILGSVQHLEAMAVRLKLLRRTAGDPAPVIPWPKQPPVTPAEPTPSAEAGRVIDDPWSSELPDDLPF